MTVVALPDDLIGDLRVLRQKAERFATARGTGAPKNVQDAAAEDLIRAAAILTNEYLPSESAATEKSTS